MSLSHSGQAGVVTGAASGIGRATALLFAARGGSVMLSDVNAQQGEALAELILSSGGKASFVRCDVSDPEQVEAMVARTVEVYGRLDFAFNNAGVVQLPTSIIDGPVDEWKRVIDINLSSVFYCMKYEMAQMAKAGKGVIINNSSDAGLRPMAGIAAYNAAKHGVIAASITAAKEGAKQGIRVNVVCPGAVDTPMLADVTGGDPALVAQFSAGIPLGRFATPDEIAQGVVWLASDAASYITGAVLPIDGGLTM